MLEYASIVWGGCATHNSDTLDKIRNEAAHIITGLTRSFPLNRLNKECDWLSLTEKRRQQKLSFMFKDHQYLLKLKTPNTTSLDVKVILTNVLLYLTP